MSHSSSRSHHHSSIWYATHSGSLREFAMACLWSLLVIVPIVGTGAGLLYAQEAEREDARVAALEAAQAHERLVEAPAAPVLPVAEATHGRELFASACKACHGPEGKGIEGLGKDLTVSDFVALQDDAQLQHFLSVGRPDARPVGMPPRAGRTDLTDQDLAHLVTWVRGLQDARRLPELPAFVENTAPSASAQQAALEAAGGDAELAGYIANGNRIFHSACNACHGQGGVGIKGNGKALAPNDFVKSLDDDKLLAFLKQGRSPSDPLNTTGIQMPPKGGNPALSDDDLLDVISYLRTLQGDATKAGERQ